VCGSARTNGGWPQRKHEKSALAGRRNKALLRRTNAVLWRNGRIAAVDIHFIVMLATIAFGIYFQTVTGFGFGMIALGVANGFDLMSVEFLAIEISLLTVCSSPIALFGHLHKIDWRSAIPLQLGIIPGTLVGIELLAFLSSSSATLLQFVLGITIAGGSLIQVVRPSCGKTRSTTMATLANGGFAGLIGGMFGFAGPPLIHYLYRQPIELISIRSTLILLFAVSSVARVIAVGVHGELNAEILEFFAWSIPVVVLATIAGRRYPPQLSPHGIRRIGFACLLLIGLSLMLAALSRFS
jgi:uncharacterized membrane protein YfcA